MTVSNTQSMAELKAPRSTVAIVRAFGVPADSVWQAITEPASVGCWFGDLTPALTPGSTARLDFGDGDFFSIADIQVEAPHQVSYTWRFLGIGPINHITWRVVPREGELGCVLTITDIEPGRTYEEAVNLREGWGDFAYRLEQYVHHKQYARYDWRRDIDASIELADQPEQLAQTLFRSDQQAAWLAFVDLNAAAGDTATLRDPDHEDAIETTDLDWLSPTRVRFNLRRPTWLQATTCELEIKSYRDGSLLTVSHGGWEHISENGDVQRMERKRFCTAWINALQQARELVAAQYAQA
ncbi:MAG TPA: SRPBCC domain-containing protein [Herpetosiphonaceae bacterium]